MDLTDNNKTKCDGTVEAANPIYPITGTVGLDEVVHTYWELQKLTRFQKNNKQVFSDTLTFTTTLSAGVMPELQIGNSSGGFKLSKASIVGSSMRTDVHKVTVAIAEKADVADLATTYNELRVLRRGGPSSGAGSAASEVIFELDQIRNREEDQQLFDVLKIQQ